MVKRVLVGLAAHESHEPLCTSRPIRLHATESLLDSGILRLPYHRNVEQLSQVFFHWPRELVRLSSKLVALTLLTPHALRSLAVTCGDRL